MAEYIERAKVVEYLHSREGNFCDDIGKSWSAGMKAAASACEKFPVADVVPVVHGRWEKTEDDFYMGLTIFKCSVCREEWVFEDMLDIEGLNYHYCPNCGAKMDKEDG